ncbi:MAG: tripartite tricarboxylate transporter TctB family protein [Proteobacteria bacterium]|nr:tripartite tricarboxylate transporter TctB family protein [Pseudomonadota bacterium]
MSLPLRFKLRKDYYGGALMVVIGVAAAYAATGYHLGTLARMGPGFFPFALGVLLALIGVAVAISARGDDAPEVGGGHGHGHALPDARGAICIVLGILAFLVLGKWGGLLPATFAIVFISALGDRSNRLKHALLLAIAMSVIAAVVFWWALQLQMPLFQWGG